MSLGHRESEAETSLSNPPNTHAGFVGEKSQSSRERGEDSGSPTPIPPQGVGVALGPGWPLPDPRAQACHREAVIHVQPYRMDEAKTPTNNADMKTELIVQ